jgi:hypothetical protein
MSWLSNPKVKLALYVNGLYFLSFYMPPSPHKDRPHFFAQAREQAARRPAPAGLPDYVPLPPPSAPSRATAYESGGLLHVSLSKDLTLVKRRGRTLLLSPSFSARSYPPNEPDFVRLNFIVYADKETCPGDCPLTITADGATLWPFTEAPDPRFNTYTLRRESVPHSSSRLEDGGVVETLAAESFTAEMFYETFLDMISAKRIIVRLGPDRVELTADQIEALRDMHRRLPQPPPSSTPAGISNSY